MAGLRSGQISGRSNSLPLKPEFEKSVKKEVRTESKEKDEIVNPCTERIGSTVTMEDLEETVREYNAQSRGEIKIIIPEKEKGYISKTYEAAMTEFRRKTAQCMTHQREIQKMDTEEKIRLNRVMKKFIEDFEKDRNYITGGM